MIYIPKGKAREYAELAANIYNGCDFGCKYCYSPAIFRKSRKEFLKVEPKKNCLEEFEKDCKKYAGTDKFVQLCFTTDPYNGLEVELELTKKCLEIALSYNIPISILTKSYLIIKDIMLLKKFDKNIKAGFTLTFDNIKSSLDWEPWGSLPNDRLKALKILKEYNISTWASIEPVIYPEQSLNMIKRSIDFVDHYKIGKINNYQGWDKKINWSDFFNKAVEILDKHNKSYYIKKELREDVNG
jgi:DNA repair photolyase